MILFRVTQGLILTPSFNSILRNHLLYPEIQETVRRVSYEIELNLQSFFVVEETRMIISGCGLAATRNHERIDQENMRDVLNQIVHLTRKNTRTRSVEAFSVFFPSAAQVSITFGYVPERDPKPKPLRGLPYEVIIFGHTSCGASRVACGMEEDETCQCVRLTPRLRCMPAMRVP